MSFSPGELAEIRYKSVLNGMREGLQILYGPGAATATRAERRRAESLLLTLRSMSPSAAMSVCMALLATPDTPSAVYAAQTTAELCRRREPEPEWGSAVLGLLRAAADVGHAKPVITALALAYCALVARRRVWSPSTLVATVCQGVGATTDEATASRALAAIEVHDHPHTL